MKRRTSVLLAAVVAIVGSACTSTVRVADVAPIRLPAKDGRISAANLQCPTLNVVPGDPQARAAADALDQQALAAAQEGDLQRATSLWESALTTDPTHARASYNLGLAFQRQNRNADAYEAFCRYLALEPTGENAPQVRATAASLQDYPPGVSEDAARQFRLGLDFAQASEPEAAMRALDQAATLAPLWPDVYYNRALMYEARDDRDRAQADLQRYIDLNAGATDRSLVLDKIAALSGLEEKRFSFFKTFGLLLVTSASVYALEMATCENSGPPEWEDKGVLGLIPVSC